MPSHGQLANPAVTESPGRGLWKTLEASIGRGRGGPVREICSAERFGPIIDRECSRSDRAGSEFSFLIFEWADPLVDDPARNDFGRAVVQRLRCTAEVGWLEGQRLGALLLE